MADIYDKASGNILRSQDTLRYLNADGSTKDGFIVNPDLSAIEGVPKKHWKLSGAKLVPMTKAQKDSVDSAEDTENTARNGRALKERRIAKGMRLAAIEALFANGDIPQAKRDAWVAKENE